MRIMKTWPIEGQPEEPLVSQVAAHIYEQKEPLEHKEKKRGEMPGICGWRRTLE